MKKTFMILLFIVAFGCTEKKEEYLTTEKWTFGGEGFHYGIPHGVGSEQEDPANGCPCVTLALGWSSYAVMTNAFAHGVTNLFEAFKAQEKPDGLICLWKVYEFEKQLLKKWGEVK